MWAMIVASISSPPTRRLRLKTMPASEMIAISQVPPPMSTIMLPAGSCTGRPTPLRMAPVIDEARARGIQIIHAPSETMEFYKDWPQRQRMLRIAKIEPPAPLGLTDPPLPIDDRDGGCDTGDSSYKAWTREIAALPMGAADVISDDGPQIYSFLRERGIRNLLVMGVHVNMCVLNRSFAIKKMTNWGIRCVLVRDLTDSMYNPKDRPYVSHDRGTESVVEHIERYWCPSVASADLMKALPEAR